MLLQRFLTNGDSIWLQSALSIRCHRSQHAGKRVGLAGRHTLCALRAQEGVMGSRAAAQALAPGRVVLLADADIATGFEQFCLVV